MLDSRCIVPLIALLMSLPQVFAEKAAADNAATKTAEAYRELFEQIDTFQQEIGNRYNAILNPEHFPSVVVSEADRAKVEKEVAAQLDTLSHLAQEPEVNWGRKTEFEEKGLSPDLGIKSMHELTNAAVYYAKNSIEEDPDRAINGLLDVMALAHQYNQEGTLLTHILCRTNKNKVIDTLAELSPQMTSAQREIILQNIHKLPKTGTLEEALASERDFGVGWLRRRLLEELEIWEAENGNSHGYRFPEDLRLAGIVLLTGKPARINLENTVKNQTFWLEIGKEINGILLEKVDKESLQAWIRLEEETAVIDLKESTFESSYVPPQVIYKLLARPDNHNAVKTDAELLEAFKVNGINPETFLAEVEDMYRRFNEAIQRLDGPVDELEKWEDATKALFSEDSFIGSVFLKFSTYVKEDRASARKQEALEHAFAIMNEDLNRSEIKESGEADFSYAETQNGFTIIPAEYIDHERSEHYGITIGKPSK